MTPEALPDASPDPAIRSGIPALIAMLAIAVSGYIWQGLAYHTWGWSLLVLIVAAGSAIAFWRTVTTGRAATTWGEFARRSTPVSYWLAVSLCFLVYVGSVATMFVARL
jgi:uncharacterized protein (DUF58 family)